MHQRQPLHAAVLVEAGDRQRALVEQVAAARPGWRLESALGHEAVEIVEALVVAHVGDHAAVLVDDHLSAFVLEAAHGGALLRRAGGIERIDLDDPAEAVGFVGSLTMSKRLS